LKEEDVDRSHAQHKILQHLDKAVIGQKNLEINKEVTLEELYNIINNMEKDKVIRMDGFQSKFYVAYWEIISIDLLKMVEESRKSCKILDAIN